MELKKARLVLACAAAFAAPGAFAACSAFDASNPSAWVDSCAPEAKLIITGSPSMAAALNTVVTTVLFDTAIQPITTVKDTSTTYPNNAANTSAWYGMSKSILTDGVPKRLFVVFNSNNGSGAGVSLLLAGSLDKKLANATKALGVTGSIEGKESTMVAVGTSTAACATPTASTTTAPQVNCTSTAVTPPDIALSDVAPGELYKLYASIAKAKLTSLTAIPLVMQGFGIAVNPGLYNALQTKNVAEGLLPSSCSAGVTSAACQPTIRRVEYAGIVTKSGPYDTATKLLGTPSAQVLTVVRRGDLSGHQAASNIHFANNACGSNLDAKGKVVAGQLDGLLEIRGASDSTASLVINEVDDAGVAAALSTTSGYAIGVLSLNKVQAGSETWKFIKLDGVSPDYLPDGTSDSNRRARLINGDYGFQMLHFAVLPTVAMEGTIMGKAAKTNSVSFPNLVDAFVSGLKESGQHNLKGIGYFLGTDTARISKVFRPGASNCAPLL